MSHYSAQRALSLTLIGTLLCYQLLFSYVAIEGPRHLSAKTIANDPESLLAQGKKLPLATADIYALELIPGISDTLAHKIIATRLAVHSVSSFLRPSTKHRAFEVIHGVGPKTAKKLSHYLDPESATVANKLLINVPAPLAPSPPLR